jgi:LemA protein
MMKTNNRGFAGKVTLIVLAIVVVLGLMVYGFIKNNYNDFATSEITVEESWSAVESQYQRRFDLVPGLVNSVKGILTQEQEVFGAIAEARTRYASARDSGSQEEQVEAYGQYESVIGRLLVIMENYPELKSYEQVQSLMDELAGTENRINIARDRYNEQVGVYNKKIVVFPRNLIANLFGFDEKPFFESDAGAEDAVEVDLTVGETAASEVNVSASVE